MSVVGRVVSVPHTAGYGRWYDMGAQQHGTWGLHWNYAKQPTQPVYNTQPSYDGDDDGIEVVYCHHALSTVPPAAVVCDATPTLWAAGCVSTACPIVVHTDSSAKDAKVVAEDAPVCESVVSEPSDGAMGADKANTPHCHDDELVPMLLPRCQSDVCPIRSCIDENDSFPHCYSNLL